MTEAIKFIEERKIIVPVVPTNQDIMEGKAQDTRQAKAVIT